MELTKEEKIGRIDAVIKVLDNYSHYYEEQLPNGKRRVKSSIYLNKQYYVCYVYASLYGSDNEIDRDIPEIELIKNSNTYLHTWLTDHDFKGDPAYLTEEDAKRSVFIKTIALEFLKELL